MLLKNEYAVFNRSTTIYFYLCILYYLFIFLVLDSIQFFKSKMHQKIKDEKRDVRRRREKDGFKRGGK